MSQAVRDFQAHWGINIEPAPAYTHEINGAVECLIQTLKTITLAQLYKANLNPQGILYLEALSVAVYLYNWFRVPDAA